MKRMTKGWGDDLRKGGTLCAGRIGRPVRVYSQLAVAGTGDMTELVDDRTLLCRDQQQHEGQCSVHVSHRNSGPAGRRRYQGVKVTD